MLYRLGLLVLFGCCTMSALWAQTTTDKPSGNLSTPQEVAYQHIYYLDHDHYDLEKAAQALVGLNGQVTDDIRSRATKLKQILDGKGLIVREDLIPDDPDHIDSSSGNAVYVPFPDVLPEVYITRPQLGNDKRQRQYANYWRYDASTVERIPALHRSVYPLGSHLLLELVPQDGHTYLGLQSWQYVAILVLGGLGFLLHLLVSLLLRFGFKMAARTQLGRDHFEEDRMHKIARLLSMVVVAYVLFIFLPVLMLPVGLSYYLLSGLRIFNTVFAVLILLNIIELGRSYFKMIVARTDSRSDDQLLPIFIRIIKVLVVGIGAMHVLAVFSVDLTAVIAGLSIGGLALALAAQDTVKNLIGSVMIYMDRPFKLGDFVTSGEVSGTVEDIGFRSTRIRTPESSLISVPNGKLADMIVNNMGGLQFRRFNTMIGVASYTPPALLEAFIEGLRAINEAHPLTSNDTVFIHLNKMGASSLDILFVVFFQTTEYAIDLKLKEEMLFSILKLAKVMQVHIAFPSTSVYIESTPEQSALPVYDEAQYAEATRAKEAFVEAFKQEHSPKKPEKPTNTNTL